MPVIIAVIPLKRGIRRGALRKLLLYPDGNTVPLIDAATEGVHASLECKHEDEAVPRVTSDVTSGHTSESNSHVVSDTATTSDDIADTPKEGDGANGPNAGNGANGPKVGDDTESGLSRSPVSDDRGTWDNKFDFLLSCLGYAVGLGNVWRFPYLCYENGGGAFLIPYAIMLLVAGLPMFFLELCIGQFSRSGPAGSWRMAPMFRGIGYGMVLVSVFIGIYYNVIITYTIYYTFSSFTNTLPWIGCGHSWNTDMCYGLYEDCVRTGHSIMTDNNTCVDVSSLTEELKQYYRVGYNETTGVTDLSNYTDPFKALRKLSSEEYFRNAVLHEASDMNETGSIVWPLFGCLAFAWIIIFFCSKNGIKSSGKVVYFTATFPYVVLVIFLILGLTLEGSSKGIEFFITPRWEILKDPKVWMDAAVQIFFSLSASWGGLLTLSSYNRFNNNCYFDAVFIAIANCVTSVFAGFVIFSILGFMAHELGRDVSEVVDQGFGLAFIAYPEVLARLPIAPVWAVLFFLMLLTLGLDSQFTILETIVTFITDIFPGLRSRKTWVLLVACCSMFLASLICVTEAGVYWIGVMDSYAAGFNILTFATLECVVICWVYGYDRFKNDIGQMIGSSKVNSKLFYFWQISWCFTTPLALIVLQVYSFIYWERPSYNGDYPAWAHVIGWVIAGTTMIFIPFFILVEFVKSSGTVLQRFRKISSPTSDWGQHSGGRRQIGSSSSIRVSPQPIDLHSLV